MSQQLQALIDNAWEERTNFSPKSAPADVRQAVADVLEQLNAGSLRVAQKDSGQWVVNQWLKKATTFTQQLITFCLSLLTATETKTCYTLTG